MYCNPSWPLRLIIISLLTFTCFSCGVSKELKEERKGWDFQNWEQHFKDRAFCKCLLEGFRNKSLQDSIRKYDKSFYDPLGIAIFDATIDVLLKEELEKMKIDSIRSVAKFPADIHELLEGKRVTYSCLQFYKSKKLAQAAKGEKVKWNKIENIMDEIHKKIPTY